MANRIAERLTPVIETAIDPKARFTTRFESYPFSDLLKMMSLPIGIAFCLNMWSFVRKSDDISFYGWRVLAHLGPYHIPHIVENGAWKRSLETLGRATELQLIESEIAQLLTDIEVVTQRRVAVRRIVKQEGFKIFLPVFENLAAPPPPGTIRKSQSHFEANLRIAMDVVSATPAADREVPISVIESLILHNQDSWESVANDESKRFGEYRAVLLLKLLQNEKTRIEAKNSNVIKKFLTEAETRSTHEPFPTLPLMPVLYQFKTEKLGYEHQDVIRKIQSMLEMQSSEISTQRKSMKLEYKIDFINFEKLVYLTICYSSLRVVPMISEYSWKVLSRAVSVVGRSVLGAAVLETWYRSQEHVIQSAPWFDSDKKILTSACMSISNIMIGAVVLRFFPFCGVPWLLMRARDSFSDSYRFL